MDYSIYSNNWIATRYNNIQSHNIPSTSFENFWPFSGMYLTKIKVIMANCVIDVDCRVKIQMLKTRQRLFICVSCFYRFLTILRSVFHLHSWTSMTQLAATNFTFIKYISENGRQWQKYVWELSCDFKRSYPINAQLLE